VEIDANTRDYWVIETVARTLERVEKSQLQEAEKKKFKQMCKDALTKLINMPQETGLPIHETPEVPAPQNIPDSPTIEAIKTLMNEGRCYEPTVGFLHPILNGEKHLLHCQLLLLKNKQNMNL